MNQQRTARNRLSQHLGREPSVEELAAEMQLSPQQIAHLDTIRQETRSLNTKVRDTNDRTELGDLVPDQRGDIEASAIAASIRRDLGEAIQRLLSEREQRFLRAYFGFATGQKTTLEAIGRHEGLTRERVRQVIAEALAKLRADPVIGAYAPTDSE
ncbi:MAG: sigma-70 domain-containing protein [Oscillochloridaceae bacterium umkhey_bin13]